jgi:hypothetical protein
MQDCIAETVRERLDDVRIHKLIDGAVIFETACGFDRLNFFCFNNILEVINIIPVSKNRGTADGMNKDIMRHIDAVSGRAAGDYSNRAAGKTRSFRVVFSEENRPAAVDGGIRAEAEAFIAREWGLRVNRSRPDGEFWFLRRSEGFSVFLRRLTRRPSWEKSLHPGELPPPLAWMLCRLAGLQNGGKAADPFSGYGAIPHEALRHFPLSFFYAADKSAEAVSRTTNKLRGIRAGVWSARRADIRGFPAITGEGALDAIITDPPWGKYKQPGTQSTAGTPDEPLDELYRSMTSVFAKVLKKGGKAVALLSGETPAELLQHEELEITGRIPILLSGRKAVIYILRKTG